MESLTWRRAKFRRYLSSYASVGRIDVNDHREVGRALLRVDAEAPHVVGQPRQRLCDAVLHLHLCHVEIGSDAERHRQRHRAVGVRRRLHVEHVLDAVDLLLERRGDGLGDDLRIRAGIHRPDDDGRRNDLGILRDRHREGRDRTEDEDDDRQDRSEDRAIDEEPRDPHGATAASACFIGTTSTVTGAPGRMRVSPRTTTRSLGVSPSRTTRSPS
jgi:hypothetical protein